MKKIAVLCKDGFEEIEALTPVDVLRRANVHVDLVGMDDLKVTSSHQITIQMDCVFNDQIKEYDGIVIPGGLPGATNLRDDARVIEIVQQFNREHKLIAAICAGPIVLAKAAARHVYEICRGNTGCFLSREKCQRGTRWRTDVLHQKRSQQKMAFSGLSFRCFRCTDCVRNRKCNAGQHHHNRSQLRTDELPCDLKGRDPDLQQTA